MLVYGDAVRHESVGEKLERVRRYLGEVSGAEPWIVGHGWFVAALIEAGELAQGIADRAFDARGGRDARSADADCAMELVLVLADLVGRSWRGSVSQPDSALSALAQLGETARDGELTVKLPEGFAHYALYPETYFEAALPLAGREVDVVGVRSIGTTLAAMVAAAVEAPCPTTVRPVGPPFGRRLALAEGDTLCSRPHAELAIVDEGPGLSGSSIAAVADAAAQAGVAPDRIHVFPSHGNGPGPEASETTKSFWHHARVLLRSFDDLVLGADGRRLESWFSDLIGAPTTPATEISGGVWRRLRFDDPADWPPAHPWQERRKFLVETASGTWLLKFAGLGRIGMGKFKRAQALAEAGFIPRPLGFRHGFIVERWREDAAALNPFGPDRPRFLARLGEYLGFRARQFPVGPDRGASARQLFDMLRVNAEEEFGTDHAAVLKRWPPLLADLEARTRRIASDNRLQTWEWLVMPDGRFLKTDAVDHHVGHDLVGCQDVAWDIAGASVEFALSPYEQGDLIRRIERASGFGVVAEDVRFMTLCYSALQLGYYREALASSANLDEAARLGAAAGRYSGGLRRLLVCDAELDARASG